MHLFKTVCNLIKISGLFLFIFYLNPAQCQINRISAKGDTITFSLDKIAGFGPQGNNSYGIGSYDALKNTEDFKAYPAIKNPPANLTNVIQYLFILDQFQFYYQNYVSGVYSKSFFLEKANEMQWRIADTVNLSKKSVKCAFAVLAGIDSAKNEVFIVDANNNNDYSDDVIKPLLKNAYSEDQIIKSAVSIQINYFSRGVIRPEKILVCLQRDRNPQKLELSFTFPEFNYTKFIYKGNTYFLCADRAGLGQSYICVLPDRPRFTEANRGGVIMLNHFAEIGGDKFKFIGYNHYDRIVLLQGLKDGFSKIQVPAAEVEKPAGVPTMDTIVSDQVGFKAPPIRGKNMNPMLKRSDEILTGNLRGKYIFVDFWSTYCAPCILELPYLKSAYDKYRRDIFEIVGVFDERQPGLTQKIFQANKVTWPNISMHAKDSDISGYANVLGFPTNYLIDPSGKIIAYNLRSEDLMNKLKELIGH